MTYFIETEKDLNSLIDLISNTDSYWCVMWVDINKHPINNSISFICIRVMDELYVVGIDHVDIICWKLESLEKLFNVDSPKFIFEKKKVLHSLDLKGNLYDIETFHYLNEMKTIDYTSFFQNYMNVMFMNKIYEDYTPYIPVMKLVESIQELFNKYGDINTSLFGYKWFNDEYIPTLKNIEESGLNIDEDMFLNLHPKSKIHIKSGKVYTEYNPFTATGRPSNRHGGVNYAALNKKDGSRKMIHSSDKVFIHFDFDGYHPRLIGELIEYEMPETSAHEWLAEIYGTSYEEGKGITFQNLYGGIMDEYKDHPYYKKADDFIMSHWDLAQERGYIETQYRKILLSWIENVNPQKAFNYLLQAYETEKNMDKLKQIFQLINGTDIYLCLYTYDSFLFEVPKDVDKELIRQVRTILSKDGFPVSYSYGTIYQEL